jgi:hypothetical protein
LEPGTAIDFQKTLRIDADFSTEVNGGDPRNPAIAGKNIAPPPQDQHRDLFTLRNLGDFCELIDAPTLQQSLGRPSRSQRAVRP